MKDVIIVGYGPTGALLANLLGQAGLQVLVLDKTQGVMEIPRAVHIDGETMRVIQAAGLAKEVLALCRPGHGMHWVNAQGETLAIREGHQGLSDQGWHNDYYFHQPDLEKAIRKGLERFSNVVVREGMEVIGHHQGVDSVQVHTQYADSSQTETFEARYLVGCDGARSVVRGWMGDTQEDLGQHQAWLVVDAQLHRPLDLPEYTIQLCDPARPATSIYVQPLRRRWEIMLLDSDDLSTITEPANVWKLLERWILPTQGVLERAATYVFHSLVGHEWQRGRLLIAGDAAHQTPPFLGQGLCAAARDVANLAWKLDMAIKVPGSSAILDTYGPERRPHAREFIELAVQMGKIIQETDPERARARDAELIAKGLTFQFPRPRLGPGVHSAKGNLAGRVAPQSILPDGRWLDDATGQKFTLVLASGGPESLSLKLQKVLTDHCVVVPEHAGQRLQRWLLQNACHAALLRPDRYVFDTAQTLKETEEMVERLLPWIDGSLKSHSGAPLVN